MIRKYVEQYLTFSKGERHAVIALSVILLVLFALPKFLPQDQVKVDDKQLLSFAAERIAPAAESASESALNTESALSSKVPHKRIYFDPNTLDAAGWMSMGVKEKTATTIQHYLEKGGRFRKPEDLLKIYGLPGALASELIAYVRIPDSESHFRSSEYKRNRVSNDFDYSKGGREDSRSYGYNREDKWSQSSWKNQKSDLNKSSDERYDRRVHGPNNWSGNPNRERVTNTGRITSYGYQSRKIHSGTVDIAIADTSALTTLPGIGSKLAARIVSFRQKLGGFHSIEQLREVFGIQDSLYQQIKPLLAVSPGQITLININTAPEETLKAHPYIRWQLAKLIVNYRGEHGPFRVAADLQGLQTLDGEGLKKLIPYVEL